MASSPPSHTPPPGAYSSPCLPPEWMWQYSPEVDEVYFIHPPTDHRVWEHPQGHEAETSFYQWLGAQLGAGGFGCTTSPMSSPPLHLAGPNGAPLTRSFSVPAADGAAAEFFSSGPLTHAYPDAFSSPGVPAMSPDGPMDRGFFSHGFGKPVKTSNAWTFKLKDFFVGDYQYRPPPPRPQAVKPSQVSHTSHGPGNASTHAPTFGTFKPPSSKYGRPNTYSHQYDPDPLITPFPPPPPVARPPSAPSPPPTYQQVQLQAQNPYTQMQFPQPATSSAYQQQSGVFGATLAHPQTSPYSQHQQLPASMPSTNPYPPRPSANPYPPTTQPNYGQSPTMNALSQVPGGGLGYVPQYNNYAPRPPQAGGYVPGKINAGAFKPRPRGMDGEDDWTEQPVEWSQPVYGGVPQTSPSLPPQ
ncbi:hypothetical protein CspeluHIS016_0211800 [Cutaneotrichosporon spelunceum]|uniref:WW domain-containing protein n=1 Tax=Cutaneotrichosporon spelunceum TaxID=1672016 RepID=A0AAD3YBT3_9TREE|nr:hypothetical protein CspeluHIS016_0211800 [Cutaneotrichosporon spelunceum]